MLTELVKSAEERCGFTLNPAEQTLLGDLLAGRPSVFTNQPILRAALLRWALTSEQGKTLSAEWGLRIDGAVVPEMLDLRAATIGCNLRFRHVRFDKDANFYLARTRSVIFEACVVRSIDLRFAQVDGTLKITEFEGDGSEVAALSTRDARISGNIDIRYTRFERSPQDPGPVGIDLERASVDGSIFIAPGNTVTAGITARDIRVKGSVHMVDLDCESTETGKPTIALANARIDGSLFLRAPKALERGDGRPRPPALGRTSVRGVVAINQAFIGGNLDCTGLRINRPAKKSPDDGSEANEWWWGLDLINTGVGGSLWLNDLVAWDYGVRVSHVRIGGNLECLELTCMRSEDTPVSPQPTAPSSPPTSKTEPVQPVALAVDFTKVGMLLLWRVLVPEAETVSLAGSSIGTFEYASSYWPKRARLDGVSFDRIVATSYPLRRKRLAGLATKHLKWAPNTIPEGSIKRWLHDAVYTPNRTHLEWVRTSERSGWRFDEALYDRLAAALARQGQPGDARHVLVARTNDANRAKGWWPMLVGLPYRLFAGNGYRPHRAVLWALGLILIGAFVFDRAYIDGTLVKAGSASIAQPFHPLVYSADTLLPIVDLHQERAFEAAGPGSEFVRVYLWIQIGLGWIIATTLGGAAASFVRRIGGN